MSLFNICKLWSTQCTDLEENYDMASLLSARFGLEEQEKDYVIVGSHAGYLSIYYPNLDVDRNTNTIDGFKPTDLLLETQLSGPILGIYAGKFSGNIRDENTNQLAVLHPNSIVIYNIQTLGGVAEHGLQLSLQNLAEYKFQRVAFAFCKGHFGKVKGREFFCIVHLDGTITIYEQDGISYECQFPGHRTLPSPIVYCERTDSFLRFGGSWNLECFTYQDLSHSSINNQEYHPVWSVCLGEGIIDMCVVQAKEDSASVMILGERNFIGLQDNGQVNFILKLDYTPKCFYSFVVGYYWEPTARLITVIVSVTSQFFIYEDANIIWAAQYKEVAPVAIQRSNLIGLPGAIIALGPTGQLRIGYLGSDPFIFKVPPHNQEEITFAQAHKELMQLEEEIKEAVDIQDMVEIDKKSNEDVRVQFSISSEIIEDSDMLLLDVSADVAVKELPSCSGVLKFKCKMELAELQIAFNMPEGIRCNQDTLTYVDVKAGAMETLELNFYIAELLHIPTTRVDVIVSFISTRGIPRVIQQTSYLPMSMFYKLGQPQKTGAIKLTYNITTKGLVPKLSAFFPEFITWESDVQALGLVSICPADGTTDETVTIVAAKNSNRIRIQSEHLEVFPMILERLIKISLEHTKTNEAPKSGKRRKIKGLINTRTASIMASPNMPTQQILHRIDIHHETQENIRKQTAEMDVLWQQFKTLQRKLQEKSDDEPKETLVMQIEENYDHLISEGDKLMTIRKDERRQRSDLTCALAVAKFIISSLQLEEKIVNVISSVLSIPIEDWTELSWEESMSPGIDMLHHYGPLNRGKNTTNTSNPMTDSNISYERFDYSRFRRHFATLFERIVRLASMEENLAATKNNNYGKLENKTTTTTKTSMADLNQLIDLSSTDTMSITAGTTAAAAAGDDNNNNPSHSHHHHKHLAKRSTLEAVIDDGEEEDEDDEDLRKEVGYRKHYGAAGQNNNNNGDNNNGADINLSSEWINEQYELPSNEELFSDLGIWW